MEITITENQMEKNLENEPETREYMGLYRSYIGEWKTMPLWLRRSNPHPRSSQS